MAGGGEKKTLRLVAHYPDACHLLDVPDGPLGGDLRRKLEVLREHCAQTGRDYTQIEKTVNGWFDLGDNPAAGRREFLTRLQELAELGFGHAMVAPRGPWTKDNLGALTELLPDIHAITPNSDG